MRAPSLRSSAPSIRPAPPRKGFFFACAAEKLSDLCEPRRQRSPEARERLIWLMRDKQPDKLHHGEEVQERLTHPKTNHEKQHDQPAYPHIARGRLFARRFRFHGAPPLIRRPLRI